MDLQGGDRPDLKFQCLFNTHSLTGTDKIIGSGIGLSRKTGINFPESWHSPPLFIFGAHKVLSELPQALRVIKGACTSMIAAHSSLYPASHTWCYLIYPLITPVSICGLMKPAGNLGCFL